MRDIHVIYADSNSADVMTLSQCKHSKKGTVRRDWNDVDNRNGRDVLEKRQRRETEGAVFETRGTGKEDGLNVLRDVLLRLRSLSAYVHVYIHELTHARPPMSSISLVDSLVGCLIDILVSCLIDSLVGCLIDSLVSCLIDSLVSCLTDKACGDSLVSCLVRHKVQR